MHMQRAFEYQVEMLVMGIRLDQSFAGFQSAQHAVFQHVLHALEVHIVEQFVLFYQGAICWIHGYSRESLVQSILKAV
jgi:hypothetical protein